MRRAAVLAATTLLLAAGCGGSSKTSTPADAGAVVAKLKAAGLPIANVAAVTAAGDPNQLLGRPNQNTGKDTFTDTRVDPSKARNNEAGAVDLGGAVEVFSNSSDAKRRAAYITSMEKSAPMFGTEYDYTSGSVLLRLSQALTPDQAAAYKAALG
jgi:hypothetical protein